MKKQHKIIYRDWNCIHKEYKDTIYVYIGYFRTSDNKKIAFISRISPLSKIEYLEPRNSIKRFFARFLIKNFNKKHEGKIEFLARKIK